MKGTVKVTAVLKDPTGVWEHEQPVEYPAGSEKAIVMRVLNGIRMVGLVTEISSSEVEVIPEGRVKNYHAVLNTVSVADNLDLAQATRGNVTLG